MFIGINIWYVYIEYNHNVKYSKGNWRRRLWLCYKTEFKMYNYTELYESCFQSDDETKCRGRTRRNEKYCQNIRY